MIAWLRKRWARVALAAAAVAVLGGWWAASGRGNGRGAAWATADKGDLVLGVEVEGTLEAVDTSSLGPPQVPWIWEYKISMMAPEGDEVAKGAPVLGFDTSELQRRLQEKLAEAEEAGKEIEKKQAELTLDREQHRLQLAEAEARHRKAQLKVEVPEELASGKDLDEARLDLRLAETEMAYLRSRIDRSERSGEAALRSLQSEKERAEQRVREIRDAIESMTVKAPRDGTVIYSTSWRGEKKKVGDSCWRGETVVEIPDLQKMKAEGEVDEADAAQVAVGQKVALRLDAHPDEEFTGEVSSIWSTVQQKSWRDPEKVVRLEVRLDRTDVRRMRPGMRFRGTIETARIANVLLVPADAVFVRDEGPVVFRETLLGFETVPVVLGRRNDKHVEVLEGLSENDRVSRTDLAAREPA